MCIYGANGGHKKSVRSLELEFQAFVSQHVTGAKNPIWVSCTKSKYSNHCEISSFLQYVYLN